MLFYWCFLRMLFQFCWFEFVEWMPILSSSVQNYTSLNDINFQVSFHRQSQLGTQSKHNRNSFIKLQQQLSCFLKILNFVKTMDYISCCLPCILSLGIDTSNKIDLTFSLTWRTNTDRKLFLFAPLSKLEQITNIVLLCLALPSLAGALAKNL